MCGLLEYSIDAKRVKQGHSPQSLQNYPAIDQGFHTQGPSQLRDYLVHPDEY